MPIIGRAVQAMVLLFLPGRVACAVMFCVLFVSDTIAFAGSKVALVIGNSNYQKVINLPNPSNDADDVAALLTQMGFEVFKRKDLGFNEMRLALGEFSRKAKRADIALIFYAGHGIEVDKHNYLVPTDAVLANSDAVDYEAVPLDMLMRATNGAKRLSLVMLDACRDNPFLQSMANTGGTRSIGRGLAQVEPTRGTLVSFAAKEGTLANDGDGRNSPYTKSLLKNLQQPGVDIQFMFRKVRDDVLQSTNGGQEPFTYGSLPGQEIFLIEPSKTEPKKLISPTQEALILSEAARVYNQIKDSKNIAVLEIFTEQFPKSVYTKFVRAELKKLRGDTVLSKPAEQKIEQVAVLSLNKAGLRSASKVLTACDLLAADGKDVANKTGISVVEKALEKNSKSAIQACKIAVNKFPQDAQSAYQLGRAYKWKLEDKAAAEQFELATSLGHVSSMLELGYMHQNGTGVIKDNVEAARLYKLAASMGNAAAESSLGYMYEYGHGVKQDYEKAASLFKRSADKGDEFGMSGLGKLYELGRGVPKDVYEAVRLYRASIEAGDQTAVINLAFLYSRGVGVEKSNRIAAELIFKQLSHPDDDVRHRIGMEFEFFIDKWPQEFRVKFQQKLIDAGYLNGSADGIIGKSTLEAIKKSGVRK